MTIDEAIAHAREEAKMKMAEYENHYDKDNHYYPQQCKRRAEEYEQIVEWLEELKDYRDKNKMVVRIDCSNSEEFKDISVKLAKEQYNKAIDDIKEKLMQNGFIYTQHALDVFNEIAEQLKAGVENE